MTFPYVIAVVGKGEGIDINPSPEPTSTITRIEWFLSAMHRALPVFVTAIMVPYRAQMRATTRRRIAEHTSIEHDITGPVLHRTARGTTTTPS
jgi:hypothetical protein